MSRGSLNFFNFQLLSPSEDGFLHVPPVTRQFLISPPASPPVGWEQPKEDKPVVDYDLIAAMAQLLPGRLSSAFNFNSQSHEKLFLSGEDHELHPSTQVNNDKPLSYYQRK